MMQKNLQLQFEKVYNNLNPAQQAAVNATEGPVMVIAGPGTGKTQILSARIAKILQDGLAEPENILCLTYTDAGTIAMRKRLLNFIGTDAYKVTIATFHAFCNDVIQENLQYFPKPNLDPISELELQELMIELVESLPNDHLFKRFRGDIYTDIKSLTEFFSTLKKENWNAEQILKASDAYINSLPEREEYIYKKSGKDYKKGDLKQNKINEEIERMEKTKAAALLFEVFQQKMLEKQRYDFDDMINWVIQAFEQHATLLLDYQERYQYILVDEFQDSSGSQSKIVQLLINYWECPNVFVVGDDDQSIYRFQGANVENMLTFANQYKHQLKTIVLTENYRSTQIILNAAKAVIEHNKERLVNSIDNLSKNLQSSKSELKNITTPIQIVAYLSPKEELMQVTRKVQKLIQQGVAPNKIAVLYKENKYGEELINYFNVYNIPYYTKRNKNLLAEPSIQNIISILKYIYAELEMPDEGEGYLFEILHQKWFHLNPALLAQICFEANQTKYTEQPLSLRRLLAKKISEPSNNLFSNQLPENLITTFEQLEKLIQLAVNVTLPQLLEQIISSLGIVPYFMQQPNKHQHWKMLYTFFDFAKAEVTKNPTQQLKHLIKTIELMELRDIGIGYTQTIGNENGVNLLTAHGSKGLEFEYVFIACTTAEVWEKKRNPSTRIKLPDTLFTTLRDDDANIKLEELRRLFYVAVTRAEKHLEISYPKYKESGEVLESSGFIEELKTAGQHQYIEVAPDINLVTDFAQLHFTENKVPVIDLADEDFINALLQKFVMNSTALNNYLDCPLNFYYNSLIKIPGAKTASAEFGSAVHHALCEQFKKMQSSNTQEFPGVEVLLKDFEWYMNKHRANFTEEEFNLKMEYGRKILPQYFISHLEEFEKNKIVSIEKSISNILYNGVPLKGKLDKLVFDGKNVTVVDYKTGSFENAKKNLVGPNQKNPTGGNYWRQAVFYKILIDNYANKGWKVIKAEFDFIEPDKKEAYQKFEHVISDEDITTVTQQIVQTWNAIQNKEFNKGCGDPKCKWCKFVKKHELAVRYDEISDADDE